MPIEEVMNIIVSGGDIVPEFDDEEEEHEHHHDDEGEDEHEHHHHHDHDHDHEHHHHHHHHHDDDDEDEPFKNLILEPEYRFSKEELAEILYKIPEDIIRVKGYVLGQNDTMIYFNYVLNEFNIFEGSKKDKALVSIIGTEIDEALFKELFHD